MAAPRVFISSTYYDLKQVRNNIGTFIRSLGYEPVMHERSSVAYTQNQELEEDCYRELTTCEIVICIIGNHFGTRSSDGSHSITMNELRTAIKAKKKIYVFISNDVYAENRTYRLNAESGCFKSAYVDDIEVHKFISELIDTVNNHVITGFDTTDQIIDVLRAQFAGLFQNLLAREASLTDSKTAYDLQQSSDEIKKVISEIKAEHESFFHKFQGSIFANLLPVRTICKHLGITKYIVFANTIDAIDELVSHFGYTINTVMSEEDIRHYTKHSIFSSEELVLKKELFNNNGRIKDIRNPNLIEKYIIWTKSAESDDSDLPF